MIKCISQETLKEFLIPYLQKNYHTLGWKSEYINAALKSAVTALITHGIINPALCSPYFHINIYTFLHNKSTVCMHDAFFSVIYDYS